MRLTLAVSLGGKVIVRRSAQASRTQAVVRWFASAGQRQPRSFRGAPTGFGQAAIEFGAAARAGKTPRAWGS